jgi:hypothetical protein
VIYPQTELPDSLDKAQAELVSLYGILALALLQKEDPEEKKYEKELDDIRAALDKPWYIMDENAQKRVRLFSSNLNKLEGK